ncbi:MAG: hypothetical protein KDN22_28855 [Verrucomicrobiae bacterium]|nr:hypothetical protein [Verrucomicrobiae bacterium]
MLFKNHSYIRASSLLATLAALGISSSKAEDLKPGVRGVVTRAPEGMKIDGDLSEFKDAFCTPVEYHNADLNERAAQFFYMWDETAFYAGLRTLDTKPFNGASDDRLWEGDAVEWYFDARQDENFRSQAWPTAASAGAVHCYWTGLTNGEVESRFCLRPGFLEAITKAGVETGSRRTEHGLEIEFKLPWENFPGFKAAAGKVIALDSELCYSDGGPRLFRSFVFGSPLSVQQPASLGKVQLVEKLEPQHWAVCGPVMMPMRVDTAWAQESLPQVTGVIALPPGQESQIGRVEFRLSDLDGKVLAEFPAEREVFQKDGDFVRAIAHWPAGIAAPGAHQVTAIVFDTDWNQLARIAPRLVSVNWETGY